MTSPVVKGRELSDKDYPDRKNGLRRAGLTVKYAFHPSGSEIINETMDAYNKAHEHKAIRETFVQPVSITPDSTGPSSASSSSTTSGTSNMRAQEHLDLVNELIQYLSLLETRLDDISSKYQVKVDALDGALFAEMHQQYVEDELEPARALMTQLSEMIVDSSIPALKKRVVQLQSIVENS
jgi:hypothetical protein